MCLDSAVRNSPERRSAHAPDAHPAWRTGHAAARPKPQAIIATRAESRMVAIIRRIRLARRLTANRCRQVSLSAGFSECLAVLLTAQAKGSQSTSLPTRCRPWRTATLRPVRMPQRSSRHGWSGGAIEDPLMLRCAPCRTRSRSRPAWRSTRLLMVPLCDPAWPPR